jgi:hypothetical protein
MEQGYAYKPSAPAPLSAAPPSEYPREGFGTRSSVDLSSAARSLHRAEAGGVSDAQVLFDLPEAREGDTAGGDRGADDEESGTRRPQAGTESKAQT